MNRRRESGVDGGIGGSGVGIAPYGRRSYLFDGTNDLVDCNAVLVPATANFELSINYKGSASGSNRIMFSQYDGGQDGRLLLYSNTTSSEGSTRLLVGDSVDGILITSTTKINDNNPHIITVTRDGSTYTLYVDGNNEGSDDSVRAIYQGANTKLGTSPFAPTANNYLWDVRIKDGNGSYIEWYKCAEGRTDAVALGEQGNNGTITDADLTTFRHNDTFGYKV